VGGHGKDFGTVLKGLEVSGTDQASWVGGERNQSSAISGRRRFVNSCLT